MSPHRIQELRSALAKLDRYTDDYWIPSLESRKKKELEFHDRYRDLGQIEKLNEDAYERFYGNEKYYAATRSSKEYVDRWIGRETNGQIFLDYCCGNGYYALLAAKAGAKLAIGLDLSSVSIANARTSAQKIGVSESTCFVQADAENTGLPENSVDRVICSGVLHHLDLTPAFKELYRIMVPGGKLMAIEALNYNPAIRLYRHLTPQMRTEWEKAHILTLREVESAKKFFEVGEIRFWHILGILEPHFPRLGNIFQALDSLLTRIPGVQLMAWMFTFELIKR
jgi:ubiquinone/menaquinone biosynthesis C-methylase UbiE